MASSRPRPVHAIAKVVEAAPVLEAAEALRDFEPDIQRGPGRKLGL